MVDPEKVEGLFRHLKDYVEVLERLGRHTKEEFLSDPNKVGNAKVDSTT